MSMLMASYQISVVNDTAQATPTNFQQLIQTTLQYPSGVRFWSPTDGWLYGWLESLSSTNQANIWVKIPSSIPANGVYQIYMVESSSLNFDGVYWGEAPTLSSSYGQYDNGANVFNFYDNFAGTSLNTNNWNVVSGLTYSVNNGFTYDGGSGNTIYVTSIPAFSNPYVVDFQGSGSTSDDMGIWFGAQGRGTSADTNLWAQRGTANGNGQDQLYTGNPAPNSFNGYATSSPSIDGNTHVYSLFVGPNNNPIVTQRDYSTFINTTTFPNSYLNGYIGPRYGSGSEFWQWIRVRNYPPNGVMPAVSIVPVQAWNVYTT